MTSHIYERAFAWPVDASKRPHRGTPTTMMTRTKTKTATNPRTKSPRSSANPTNSPRCGAPALATNPRQLPAGAVSALAPVVDRSYTRENGVMCQ